MDREPVYRFGGGRSGIELSAYDMKNRKIQCFEQTLTQEGAGLEVALPAPYMNFPFYSLTATPCIYPLLPSVAVLPASQTFG